MKKDNKKQEVKVREDIAFNYLEHYPFLFTDTPIKDKEQIIKTSDGVYRIMYKDSSGQSQFCNGFYLNLDSLMEKEGVKIEKCFCLN